MTIEEYRKELGLSIRSTRGLLHQFRRDEERDELDGLLDQVYGKADRDDLRESDSVKLLALLRVLRQAMSRALNGEAVLWTDINTLKACIRKTLDPASEGRDMQAFRLPQGNETTVRPALVR